MEAYGEFAEVYDLFMEEVPYGAWCDYLKQQLREHGVRDGLLLDLGCGTGTMTSLLAKAGYDMIGVDRSEEMLRQAYEKKQRDGQDILYLCQDMSAFELYGTVRGIVCVCDALNYILEEKQLLETFRLVNNYLDPGGLFLFDMNTPYKYSRILGDHVFAQNRQEGSYIWENHFDRESGINEYAVTFYVRQEEERYRRFEEIHYQRAYSPHRIRQLLSQAGLALEAVYDGYRKAPPRADSQRICFVARECTKKQEG